MTCKDTLIAKPSQILLPFATIELVENHKPTILNHNLSTCVANSPRQKSSKTTEAASISNQKGFKPYWSVLCAEISSKLLLPIGTDSPDAVPSISPRSRDPLGQAESAERLYDSWSNKTVEKSWFSTRLFIAPKRSLLPICSQYSISFSAECTDSGDTVIKSKKIEISPTTEQKAILRKWFGGSRFFYNWAVDAMNDGASTNFKMLAPQLIADAPDWHVDIPRQIKVGAVMDACQAVRNAKVKCKQTGKFQKMKFRSRKQPHQTLYLRADTLKERGFYVRLLGEIKMTESLPAKPQGQGRDPIHEVKDSQLIMENGRYFLCVAYVEKRKPREPSGKIVALDPGVRTFMTYFTEDGFGWLGYQAINRIQRLCQHLDNLLCRAATVRRPLRRTLRQAANKIRVKIRNLVDELHKKVAYFLVTHYDIILLPTFESQQMCKRGKRNLRKKSVRQMLTLSHYRFKQRLKQKALEYGVQVIDVCEAYTSKTASWTGEVIEKLGGAKVITVSDGARMDRDLNGARGIFVKSIAGALTVLPSS